MTKTAKEAAREPSTDNVVKFSSAAPGRPFGYRVLVQVAPVVEKVGSIYLPPGSDDVQRELATIVKVIAIGPAAFNSTVKFEGDKVEPGDHVLIGKYNGAQINMKDRNVPQYRVINDDEILAVIERPDDIHRSV